VKPGKAPAAGGGFFIIISARFNPFRLFLFHAKSNRSGGEYVYAVISGGDKSVFIFLPAFPDVLSDEPGSDILVDMVDGYE
jgi:hypothetical protein